MVRRLNLSPLDADSLSSLMPIYKFRSDGRLLNSNADDYAQNDSRVYHVKFASKPPRPDVVARLAFLRDVAMDEAVPFSDASEADLIDFLKRFRGACSPKVFLLDSGNTRAVWRESVERHIALEFLGNSSIDFVMFGQRASASVTTRMSGVDTTDGVIAHIRSLSLTDLFYR